MDKIAILTFFEIEELAQASASKGCTQLSLLEKNTKALQYYNKDQISESTILATLAIPTRLMKEVTIDRAHCPGLAPMHIIEKTEALPSCPAVSREQHPVQ
jgi:hypothetical protein